MEEYSVNIDCSEALEDFKDEISDFQEVYAVDKKYHKSRLDAVLADMTGVSRSQIQRWINGKHVFVDGNSAEPSLKLKLGQTISLNRPPLEPAEPKPDPNVPINAVYEDEHILVLNKQRGVVVHPGAGVYSGTLVNGLLAHCRDLSGIGGVERPGIVHRLDKDTSGLMAVAKDDVSHAGLSAQFAERRVTKLYRALTFGVPNPERGIIEQPIGRSSSDRKLMAVRPGGRYAKTEYKVIEPFGKQYSWTELHIFTGRTHQIRVHLTWLGFPIVGDPLYRPRFNEWNLQGQALHCCFLSFCHPVTGKRLEFTAEEPPEIAEILEDLRKR